MGQLEVYNINEIYLNGLMISLFINYMSEEQESNTFESFKAYIYSANFSAKHFRRASGLIVTPDKALHKILNSLDLFKIKPLTKTIDEYPAWQDESKLEVKVDENILKIQSKYENN